jgi:hypothetical protein
MVSCRIMTPSIIFLPGMKVVCVGLTTVFATLFSLLVPNFVKNLETNIEDTNGSILLNLSGVLNFWN